MNWKLVVLTYGLLFLAELGDKTQISVMSLSAEYRSPWSVFLGASLALITTTLIGAFLGRLVIQYVPVEYVRITAGVLFLGIGALMILRSVSALAHTGIS